MKILLIKYRNIGDTLLSSALISNLKHHYPNAAIDFALNKGCEEMLSNNPDINKIIIYDRQCIKNLGKFHQIIEEIKLIRKIRNTNYEVVINLTEGEKGAILVLFSKAKKKLGYKIRKGILSKIPIFHQLANDVMTQHAVEKDLQFIPLLGHEVNKKNISILWPSSIEQDINNIVKENHLNDYVHVHPVSRWMFKCWEDDRMASVIDYLYFHKKYQVVITGSLIKNEMDRINKIITLCKSEPLNLSGKLTLKHLACLSSKAKFFFGIDSAPAHIAAATNTSVISILGASEASKWGVWANEGKNLYVNKGIQKNSQHVVLADDNHSIIYIDGVKKCQGMLNITLESVEEVINEKY